MSTYSGLMVHDDQKGEYQFSKVQVLTLNYEEPFDRHYLYIGVVDNQNAMRHDGKTKHQVGFDNAWDHPQVGNHSLLIFSESFQVILSLILTNNSLCMRL